MKKNIPILLVFLLPFCSISQVEVFSFDNIIDSLKIICNDVIVYKQYYSSTKPTETKIYIAYKQNDVHKMISLILIENKVKRYDQFINKGIFLIYENNFTEITKLLLSSNNFDSQERKPDGTIVIKKKGSSHGTGYYFRIINKQKGIDVQKEYCCGLVENQFFIEELYPIWLLMSAFEMEYKIGEISSKYSHRKCRKIFRRRFNKKHHQLRSAHSTRFRNKTAPILDTLQNWCFFMPLHQHPKIPILDREISRTTKNQEVMNFNFKSSIRFRFNIN